MDPNRAGGWANVGNFIVGCIALYLMWKAQHPSEVPAQGTAIYPSNSLPLAMWIFLGGLVAAGILHVSASLIQSKIQFNSTHRQSSDSKRALPTKIEGRIFVGADITPRFLIAFFDEHVTVEAKRLIDPYLGKWIRVSGILSDVGELRSYGSLVHMKCSESLHIVMTFDEEWVNHLAILRKGSPITVVGQIDDGTSSLGLHLDHCELVST